MLIIVAGTTRDGDLSDEVRISTRFAETLAMVASEILGVRLVDDSPHPVDP